MNKRTYTGQQDRSGVVQNNIIITQSYYTVLEDLLLEHQLIALVSHLINL